MAVLPSNVIGSALSSGPMWLWNELTGRNQQQEQNAWNRQQALEQYQREVQMWQMQNEYNSPKSQMERYQAAGLNPNLIYSSGNASAGNASGYPTYQPAQGVGRPTGMETLSKVASVIGTLIGLKGQLASADAAAARAKQMATTTSYLPDFLQHRNFIMQGKANYYWSPQYFDDHGRPINYKSWSDLYNSHPEEFFRKPYFMDYLLKEQNLRSGSTLLKYQDALQNAALLHAQRINNLLSLDQKYYNLDKWIGYGTQALGGLLGIGKFGLGLKGFKLRSRYY